MDAEEIVLGLEATAYDLGHATSVRHEYLKHVEAGAAFIERMTKPLTLDECCEILNANEYLFLDDASDADNAWVVGREGIWI